MINICNLSKQYGHQPLFRHLDLDVAKGSVVAIIGPSGSGKSTLLRCINGLETFQGGCISVDGQKLFGYGEQGYHKALNCKVVKNIRRKVGMVFQQFNLFPHLTALHNVTVSPVSVLGIDKTAAESHAISLLRKVQLDGKVDSYPGQLSGGEQQRVAIARALAMKPDAMLFDEPTSSLDPEMIDEVLAVIKDLVSEGMTTIIATHEMDFARNVSTQVVFMEKGEIIECGNPQDMFSNPTNNRTKVFVSNFMGKFCQ